MIALETVMNGLMLGSLYALFGLGLSLIFGVMKIANIAHGEFVISGAYLVFFLSAFLPLPIWIVIPIAAVAMFFAGYALQHFVVNRVLGDEPLRPMLLTFGLSILLQNLYVELAGADNRAVDPGWLATANVEIGGMSLGLLPLGTFVLAILLFGLLHWVLHHTRFGRIVRATSDDPEIVAVMAVERRKVFATIMGISTVLAAIAGILLAMRTSITPFSGAERLLIAFEVIVIGGLGSIWASLAGGLVLGVVHAISFRLDPASGLLYGHILLLLILLARPEGLAGRQRVR